MDTARLEKNIAYRFNDHTLLRQALTHRSFSSSHNERLEFLGDAILSAIVSEYLYQHFTQHDEGSLSRQRAALVRGEALAGLANDLGVGDFVRLGKGEESTGGRQRQSILENAVEALIGAIYLDSDWQRCKAVVLTWLASRLDSSRLPTKKNPKSALQEWLQARNMPLPVYQILNTSGVEHAQIFEVSCEIEGSQVQTRGEGSSLKKAEQQAAQQMLQEIRNRYE